MVRALPGRKGATALGFWTLYASAIAIAVLQLGADPGSGETQPGKPLAPGSPTALIERYDCWSDEAPHDMAGKLPGHAIVATGSAPRYVGSDLTGHALDQIFAGKDHGLVVYAFCR